MKNELSLGKIFGIRISIDYSWLIIFALVTYSFSQNLLPFFVPGRTTSTYLLAGAFGALLFFASILLHELFHSVVARYYHLKVDKITLFLFGGVANLSEEPPSAKVEFLMSIAGPLSSLVIGTVFISIYDSFILNNPHSILLPLMQILGVVNIALALFNLLPGFPLDGGRVLRSIIWWISGDILSSTKIAVNIGKLIAVGLIAYGIWQIFRANLFGGIWLGLIGYFLYQAAESSYVQTLAATKLSSKSVQDLMNKNLDRISVKDLEAMKKTTLEPGKILVAEENGKDIGIIINNSPERRAHGHGTTTYIALTPNLQISNNTRLIDVIKKMTKGGLRILAITDHHRVRGIITNKIISQFLGRELAATKH